MVTRVLSWAFPAVRARSSFPGRQTRLGGLTTVSGRAVQPVGVRTAASGREPLHRAGCGSAGPGGNPAPSVSGWRGPRWPPGCLEAEWPAPPPGGQQALTGRPGRSAGVSGQPGAGPSVRPLSFNPLSAEPRPPECFPTESTDPAGRTQTRLGTPCKPVRRGGWRDGWGCGARPRWRGTPGGGSLGRSWAVGRVPRSLGLSLCRDAACVTTVQSAVPVHTPRGRRQLLGPWPSTPGAGGGRGAPALSRVAVGGLCPSQ